MIQNPPSSALESVPFLASLDVATLERLAAKARLMRVRAGETVVHEGQDNDALYVVAEGAMQVYSTAFNGADVVLARLEIGQWFGERALASGGRTKNEASVRALEDSRLLMLSQTVLASVVSQDHTLFDTLRAEERARRSFRDTRVQDEMFTSVGLSPVHRHYRVERFPAGAVVYRRGDPAERAYLIQRGRARVQEDADARASSALELSAGQFFGEVAVLDRSAHTATVVAAEELEVASLEAEWFRTMHGQSEKLRSITDALRAMYSIPRRGVTTLQTSQVGGHATQVAVHALDDGRRVVSMRLVGRNAFTSRVTTDLAGAELVSYDGAGNGVYRELNLAGGKLQRIYSEGDWTGLGAMLDILLDARPVEAWQIALFRERGDFRIEEARPLYEGSEVICACTKTTCAQIMNCIRGGAHTLEAVAAQTKATLVCGGCAPLVNELLGKSDWSPAHVIGEVTLTPDIRTFRIQPATGVCKPYRPGQHVLLQARIDNKWVQRAYTLSSAPEAGGAYEITVKREPQGVFSRWLFDRRERGSLIRVSEPGGSWYLPDEQSADVVFLAGGIGVTPALAMLRSSAARPRAHKLHLDYSVSVEDHAICRDELAGCNGSTSVKLRVTSRDGRLSAAGIEELLARFPGCHFFLCGSNAYVAGVRALLDAAGVAAERVRVEVFSAAGEKPKRRPEDGSPSRPGMPPLEPEDLPTPLDQARDVIHRFYTVTGALSAFDARWAQVESDLKTTGTYHMTAEELTYAARLAWRNQTRCIGRLYWDALSLRDFRHVTTGEGMLDAIMGHIETATNRGSIRPVITVFPPRRPDGQGPRVWSPQFFRYAGYRQADGSVLGDPGNRELTDVAMALGWKPPEKRGRFDLLPIIVQAVGEKPAWREIPPELVLEVPIVHPRLAWFADLGLKWYALPAVSAMLFNGGGLEYTAAPFNGWYMGTEIGARNFGDTDRYNMLPEVARRMGLDMSSDRTLWRDQAMIELNIAVLHSYDKAGVTMMDHHAASNSFDKFERIESELGRVVHANWAWIVPPISGSAVTAFHRSHWKDVELKPNYYGQPDAWKVDRSWKVRS